MSPYTFNFIIFVLVAGVLASVISVVVSFKVPKIKSVVWESDDYSTKAQMYLVITSLLGTVVIVGVAYVLDLGTTLVYYPHLARYAIPAKFSEIFKFISNLI